MSSSTNAFNPDMSTPQGQADDLRQKGNHEFQNGNLDSAISLYSAGLDVLIEEDNASAQGLKHNNNDQMMIVLLCNRSACYFQLLEYESALDDSLKAYVELSKSTNIKAAYRLAKTYIALEKVDDALQIIDGVMASSTTTKEQMKSFESLIKQAMELKSSSSSNKEKETSIKFVSRPISIREFDKPPRDSIDVLGLGNFSEIVICTHKVTEERFALKMLEKKKADDLAKRQHPNVYNEIAMESRVLLSRLPPHPNIIKMYHSFQDYTCIYFLQELHCENKDLWSCLKYKKSMVGAYPSQVQIWIYQLISAIEHCHRYGIVHRDIKPENVLLDSKNHVVLIDFGTAKDLIVQDLNGPEFVGTPDFMSPEAVTGVSSMKNKPTEDDMKANKVATPSSDLWALGGTLYIMLSGSTPFWSPSPYLTFLRIQRGLIHRLGAHCDDDAWDLIQSLMQVDRTKRLGADVFNYSSNPDAKEIANMKTKSYDCLRIHPYFKSLKINDDEDDAVTKKLKTEKLQAHVIPSLQDLCLRKCSDMVQLDALDLDLCDNHPPGDGSKHDLLRLSEKQRSAILHVLEKSKIFQGSRDETRVLQRFYKTQIDVLKGKVDYPNVQRHEFVGLTRMVDDEYKLPSHRGSEDPYATKDKLLDPQTNIVVISNPLLLKTTEGEGGGVVDEAQEKLFIQQWKQCIGAVNKQRPKAVVVCGQQIPKKFWKFMGRIRDTIPIIWNDGSKYYTFWLNGFQGIMLQSSDLISSSCQDDSPQMKWISEQMEQSRMAKHRVYCFVDCDPRELPDLVIKRLARGRVLALIGLVSSSADSDTTTDNTATTTTGGDNNGDFLDYTVTYEPNEKVVSNKRRRRERARRRAKEGKTSSKEEENVDDDQDDHDDDDVSVKSNDSVEDDGDRATMRVLGTSQNSLRWLTIDEKEDWTTTLDVMVGEKK